MIKNSITYYDRIWSEQEYNYRAAYGFIPGICAYLHEDAKARPAMVVVPGGGYCMVCNHEGESVADEFFKQGMNVFVLTYTTDITMSVPLHKQPLCDAARAVRFIRKNAERFRIIPDRLSICGFSAGGHLCASLATHFDDVQDNAPEYSGISARPDGVILGYPVITSGQYTHIYSMQALMGYEPSQEEKEYFSLENQVSKATPPCFIWQTVEDNLVPVENSMLFASACRENGVPYAYYAFPFGPHGLSIWSDRIRRGDSGERYTFEQLDLAVEAVKNRTAVDVSEKRRRELMIQFFGNEDGVRKEDADAGKADSEGVGREDATSEELGTEECCGGEEDATSEKLVTEECCGGEEDATSEELGTEESRDPDFPDVAMWPKLANLWLKAMKLL